MTIQTIFVDSCAKRMHHLGLQVKLSYDQFGNFVVQKLLETGDLENHLAMLKEVKGHVPRCFFLQVKSLENCIVGHILRQWKKSVHIEPQKHNS